MSEGLLIATLIVSAITPIIVGISEFIKHIKRSKCMGTEIEMEDKNNNNNDDEKNEKKDKIKKDKKNKR